MSDGWVFGVLALHGILVLASLLLAARRRQRLSASLICFSVIVPFFGAVIAFLYAVALEPSEEKREHLMRAEKQEAIVTPALEAMKSVPLEEALLMNTPTVRRELMMNLLRSDPRKHLDLLVFARYNEDPETAHYATATLTEAQRQIELEMQQMQAALAGDPKDTETRISYIQLMDAYAVSGLLEGHLLDRQRLEMRLNLEALPLEAVTPELASLEIRNLLTLQQASQARAKAEEMLARWPLDEHSWLEMLRVYVETHDEKGMHELKGLAEKSGVDWSGSGLERAQYFWGEMSGK
jgi:hypothetical protein